MENKNYEGEWTLLRAMNFFPGSIVLLFVWVPKTPYTVYLWPHLIFIIKGKVRNRDTLINKKNYNRFLRSLFIIFFSLLQTMRPLLVEKKKRIPVKEVDKIFRHTLKCVLCHFMWLKVGITSLCGVGRDRNDRYEKNMRTTIFIVIYRDSVHR